MTTVLSRRMLIAGAMTEYPGLPRMDVTDPNTGQPFAEIALADAATIDASLSAAVEAQAIWAAMTPKARSLALHAIVTRIEQADLAPLLHLAAQELGKPGPEATGEIEQSLPAMRYFAELARHDQGQVAGETYTQNLHYSRYDPMGVTLHMTPFNYPILLLCWTVAASLMAGNAVVIKPSERASLITLAFLDFFSDLPPGLVSCVTGGVDTAQALIADPRIAKVAFTGSAHSARAVYQSAARHMKPVLLEGGGSDALIVSDKCDVDIAAAGAANGAFTYSGQVCTSIERIFVVRDAYESFLDRLAHHTRALRVGPAGEAVDLGPVISNEALTRIETLVTDACARGARLICGGSRPETGADGWFFLPTVLADDAAQTPLVDEEIFGPVAIVTPVADIQDAIARANASRYGLGASIFTEDLQEAIAASRQLQVGMVWVNNPLIDNDALPFGGVKASGMGRELGRHGLDEFRNPKMVVIEPKAKRQSWWIPYSD